MQTKIFGATVREEGRHPMVLIFRLTITILTSRNNEGKYRVSVPSWHLWWIYYSQQYHMKDGGCHMGRKKMQLNTIYKKKVVNLTIWFLFPFLKILHQLDITAYLFCSYCIECFGFKWILEAFWHFQRISVLWNETPYNAYWLFKRPTFWMEERRNIHFLKINNMVCLNHVHSIDFLASDSWFQLICIADFQCPWICKPGLRENEDKKGKLTSLECHMIHYISHFMAE